MLRAAHLLLLHDLKQHLVLVLHVVKLVKAADALVCKDQRSCLKRHVIGHNILGHRHCESSACTAHAVHKEAVRRRSSGRTQQLALAQAWVSNEEHMRVATHSGPFHVMVVALAATKQGQDDAELHHIVTQDGGAQGLRKVKELVRRASPLEGDNKMEVLDSHIAKAVRAAVGPRVLCSLH